MRKTCIALALVLAVVLPAVSSAAKKGTPDKTYTNSEYKFRLNYPGTWNSEESEKAKVDVGYGVEVPMGKMMPKMCSVRFSEDLKSKDDEIPNLNLMVMTYEPKSEKASKKEAKKEEKAKKEKQDCVIVEQRSITWAGQKAMLTTTRCPETKKVKIGDKKQKATVWRYVTAVNMKRGQDMYNLVGEFLCTKSGEKLCDEFNDKGKAAEFDTKLKPARDKIVATTKFVK